MVRIISRAEWGARPPTRRSFISTPTPRVYAHHTADNTREAAGVRSSQNFHMNVRGWTDVAYSFMIDRVSGNIYTGRGPGVSGGHTAGQNTVSHAICVMGNFENYDISRTAVSSVIALLVLGQRSGWWLLNLFGHRDAPGASTACPGRRFYGQLPHIRTQARAGGGSTPTPTPTPGGFMSALSGAQQRHVYEVSRSFNARVTLLTVAAIQQHVPKVLDEKYNFNGRIVLLVTSVVRQEVPKAVKQALKEAA